MNIQIYGVDKEYDQKCIKLYTGKDKIETCKNLQKEIASFKKMLDEIGEQMEKYCILGYSWSETMRGHIKYYSDMLLDIDNII
jgi:hypothetical protein